MTDLIFTDEDESFKVRFRTDLLPGNDGLFTVMHVDGLDDAEERHGLHFRELDYSLGEFKDFAKNNNLKLERNDGSNSETLVAVTALNITTTTLPDATQSSAYDQDVETEGGVGDLTFSVDSGSLPSGMSLDTSTGKISGTPDTQETANFDIKVADEFGNEDTQSLSITVNAP